jgi:phosphoribosylformylglycinamidine cyclo-ligase
MAPTRLYVKPVLAALAAHPIKALAHITGGGLLENIPRVLPEGWRRTWTRAAGRSSELFAWLQATAGIDDHEMNRTFNNGIGMVVVVDAAHADATPHAARRRRRAARRRWWWLTHRLLELRAVLASC